MYLSIKQACARLNMSRPTFDQWRKHHGLPVEQIGGKQSYRISAAALEAWQTGFTPPKAGRPRKPGR